MPNIESFAKKAAPVINPLLREIVKQEKVDERFSTNNLRFRTATITAIIESLSESPLATIAW